MQSLLQRRLLMRVSICLSLLLGAAAVRADSLYVADADDNSVKQFDASSGA